MWLLYRIRVGQTVSLIMGRGEGDIGLWPEAAAKQKAQRVRRKKETNRISNGWGEKAAYFCCIVSAEWMWTSSGGHLSSNATFCSVRYLWHRSPKEKIAYFEILLVLSRLKMINLNQHVLSGSITYCVQLQHTNSYHAYTSFSDLLIQGSGFLYYAQTRRKFHTQVLVYGLGTTQIHKKQITKPHSWGWYQMT